MCVAIRTIKGRNLTIGSELRFKDGTVLRWNPDFPFRRSETIRRQYRGKPDQVVFIPVPIASFIENNTHGYERSVRRYEESPRPTSADCLIYAVFIGEPYGLSKGLVSLMTEGNESGVGGPMYHPRRPFLVEARSFAEAKERAFSKLFRQEE